MPALTAAPVAHKKPRHGQYKQPDHHHPCHGHIDHLTSLINRVLGVPRQMKDGRAVSINCAVLGPADSRAEAAYLPSCECGRHALVD